MKVLQFLLSGGSGGAEMFFVRLGRALHRRDVAQHLVLAPHDYRESYLLQHGIPHTVLDIERNGKWREMRKLARIIRTFEPDIVVAWMDRAGRNIPRGRHRTIGRIGGFYELKNYRRCELIVANSPALVQHARKEGRDDAVLIANFVEIENHPPVDRSSIKRPLLFSSGRLSDQKGYDILIRALAQTDAHLWIAGRGGGQLERLKQLASDLGIADRVEFLGWRQDIGSLLSAADIFVMPSRYEGTSNSLLEAMSARRPIITTSGESVSWFLKDGENARIIEPDNPADLAQTINELANNRELASRIASGAKATYEADFGEDAVVSRWIEVMEKLKSSPPQRRVFNLLSRRSIQDRIP